MLNITRNPETICRHYLPLAHNDACEANVIYNDLATQLDVRRSAVRDICMGRCAGCPSYQTFAPTEIAAEEKSLSARLARVQKAREKVVERANGKRGVWGHIDCPCCPTGQLYWSVADHDPHLINGHCDQPDCVRWKEY